MNDATGLKQLPTQIFFIIIIQETFQQVMAYKFNLSTLTVVAVNNVNFV